MENFEAMSMDFKMLQSKIEKDLEQKINVFKREAREALQFQVSLIEESVDFNR